MTKRRERTKQKPAKPAVRKRHDKRELAKTMFISSNMTATEIAKALELNEKTVGSWRSQDSWDEERTTRNVSPIAIIKRLNESIMSILDNAKDDTGKNRPLTTAESDNISKLSKSIKSIKNAIEPQTVMEVLNGFTIWTSSIDMELSKQIAEKAVMYVQIKLKESKDR